MSDIQEFLSGPANAIRKLNELIRVVNSLNKIAGDNFVKVNRTGSGVTIGLNWPEVLSKIPSSVTTTIRRAITTAAAGAGSTITANLYNSAGVEQTTGSESGITVYCTICGGTALNSAIPYLENDDDIFVVKLPYSSTEQRWYCLQIFQTLGTCP